MTDDSTDYYPPARARARRRRPLVVGVLAVVLVAGLGLLYYWIDWERARQDLRGREADYNTVYQTFLNDLHAGNLDAAYDSTTDSFRERVSRAEFETRVQRYLDFEKRPGVRGAEGGHSGGHGWEKFDHVLEDADGNRLKKTLSLTHEDGFLHRRPPPPRVDDFTADELAARPPRK
jgi:hypothetical protein